MKTKISQREILLNTIIVALCASAVFLFFRAVFFDVDSISGGIENLLTAEAPSSDTVNINEKPSSLAVSYPLYTLVTREGGSHYAEKYENNEKNSLSNTFTAIFGEALGSAGVCEKVSESEWQYALKNPGVFLDYVFPQSLGYLSSGLGTLCSDSLINVLADRFILSIDNDKLYLYYQSKEDGFYRCETASSVTSLSSKIVECPVGFAQFAFEYGSKYEKLDPYFIFTNEKYNVPDISSENLVTSTLDNKPMLEYFGINEKISPPYTETDGSTIYVDGDKRLRFDSDGLLIYNVSSGNGITINKNSSEPSLDDVLLTCAAITKNVFSKFGVSPTLGVTDISIDSSPSDCTVSFGQYVNGIPITIDREACIATYRIRNGSIVYINIILRSYTASKLNSISPLPEKQMAAIVNETGGDPVLIYVDNNEERDVSWMTLS